MRTVGKTRFSVKYLCGGQDKLWVSKAGQNEAGIKNRKWNDSKRLQTIFPGGVLVGIFCGPTGIEI